MPKGGATSLIPVSAGLRADLDTFLKAFLELRTIRFTDFKKLFQQRNMIELHNGRSESVEIIEFNEQLLIHCLPYIKDNVRPGMPRSLEERLFGLYSLYTFFYTQAVGHTVKIRVDPDNSLSFRQLTELVKTQGILDAYMVCLKLLEDQAFKHVAFLQVFDPALFKRFGDEDQVSRYPVHINPNDPLARIKGLRQSREFQKLQAIHNEYNKLKAKSGIDFEEPPLRTVEDAFQEVLGSSVSMDSVKREIVIPIPTSYEKPKSSRAEIKERAYQQDLILSRTRRHCTTDDIEIKKETFDFDAGDIDIKKETFDFDAFSATVKELEAVPKKRFKTELNEFSEACASQSALFESEVPLASSQPPNLSSSSSASSTSSAFSLISVKKEVISDDDYITKPHEANTSDPVTPKSILKKPGHSKPIGIKRRIKFLGLDEVQSDDEYFDATDAEALLNAPKVNKIKKETRDNAFAERSNNPVDTEMSDLSDSPKTDSPPLDASEMVFDVKKRVKREMSYEPKDEQEEQSSSSGVKRRADEDEEDMFRELDMDVEEEIDDDVDEIMDLSSEDEGVLSIVTDF